jgi:hypothetical protein
MWIRWIRIRIRIRNTGIQGQKDAGSVIRIRVEEFCSRKNARFIPDPDPDPDFFIPDPWVKKAPDSGSAILVISNLLVIDKLLSKIRCTA